jgi:hypothetical protein
MKRDPAFDGAFVARFQPRKLCASYLRIAVFVAAGLDSSMAQVFEVTGGSSSLFDATGGAIAIHATNSEMSAGLGSIAGRMRFGGDIKTELGGYDVNLGDNYIPFRLPTDIFDQSHYFLGQGLGAARHTDTVNVFGFAGATSTGYQTPYFQGALANKAVALFFMDGKLTSTLRLFSRQIFSSQQTAIEGLEWEPAKGLKAALAGGLGANRGYGSSTVTLERGWVSLKAGYILASNQFRRVSVQTPLNAETDRGNVTLKIQPNRFFSLTAGHQNLLQPISDRENLRATVNHLAATARVAHFILSGSQFDSQVRGVGSSGLALSATRDITSQVQVGVSRFVSRTAVTYEPSVSTLWNVRERLSQRLSLAQYVNQSQGHTSISFGGDFTTNRVSAGMDY